MHVDVLVATRNRPDDLRRMLATVTSQTHEDFTLLVLDQSDDVGPNREAVADLGDERIVHVSQPDRGKSKALNDGLRRTDSAFVAFTDDDCELRSDWLEKGVSALRENEGTGMLFGTLTPFPHDETTHFVPAIDFAARRTLVGPLMRSHGLVGMGANMMIRRSALETVGMFDEDLGPGGRLHTGEEIELAYRVLRAEYDILQDPAPVIVHRGERPIAGNVATDLVNTGFFAMGAGYGKHLRARDWRAGAVAGHEILRVLGAMGSALARRRPPFHVRRLVAFTRGLLAGFVRGPGWPSA